MENTVKKCTGYTLSELRNMTGAMDAILADYRHLEDSGPYQRLYSQVNRMRDRILEEIERREDEAEAAYFKSHPELNP